MKARSVLVCLPLLAAPAILMAAPPQDPLKVPPSKIYVTTTIPVGPELSATLTEFFTGEKSEKTAMNVLLGLHRLEDGRKKLLASRDYNADAGGFVSRASLEVVDLDRDGTNEVMVTYHHNEQPGSTRVELDVLRVLPDKLALVWNGLVRVDTTAPSLRLQPGDREKYVREVDFNLTLAAEGRKICFKKTVLVAAGVTLDTPRVLSEEFPVDMTPQRPPSPPGKAKGEEARKVE